MNNTINAFFQFKKAGIDHSTFDDKIQATGARGGENWTLVDKHEPRRGCSQLPVKLRKKLQCLITPTTVSTVALKEKLRESSYLPRDPLGKMNTGSSMKMIFMRMIKKRRLKSLIPTTQRR